MSPLPPDQNLNDVLVKIKEAYRNPNVRSVTQVVLKDGPRAFRIATLLELIDPGNGEFHHYSLKIDQIDRTKAGWFSKPEKSIRLDGSDPDEISKLHVFLEAALKGSFQNTTGELHLIRGEEYAKLEQLIRVLPDLADTDKLELVKRLLSQLESSESSIQEFIGAFSGTNGETLRHIATASRLVEYRQALETLRQLVADPETSEAMLQKHLEQNPWMFGSEYSELLQRRTWTRDDRLDYMLRRTVDNYLEIIEIKTPFREPLFVQDRSRNLYFPSARLSPVIGQIIRYIEEVERSRDQILAKDNRDCLKIRARAIIGRDGSADEQAALHNLNAHLVRIEVMTFDQLLRIAERVLSIFESGAATSETDGEEIDDDIPF